MAQTAAARHIAPHRPSLAPPAKVNSYQLLKAQSTTMAVSLSIETIDQSDRWYFVPGTPAEYELRVRNASSSPQHCTFAIEEPIDGGSIEPASAILQPHIPIVLRLRLNVSWSTREAHVVVAVRDLGGMILATIVRPIATATVSDCTVSIGWKEAIVADSSLRGFILHCYIRNIGKLTGAFQPRFKPHPALSFPSLAPSILGPGEAIAIDVPVIWNRAMRDDEGFNHPRMIEVEVPAGGARRSAATPWETVQLHLRRYLNEQDTEVLVPLHAPPSRLPKGGSMPVDPASADGAGAAKQSANSAAGSAPKASALFARAEFLPAKRGPANGARLLPYAFAAIGLIAIVIVAFQLPHLLRAFGPAAVAPVPTATVIVPQIGSNGTPGVKHASHVNTSAAERLLQRVTSNAPAPDLSKSAPAANTSSGTSSSSAVSQTPAPAETSAAANATSIHHAALPPRPPPINRELVVTLDGITAWYGHNGHVVHVTWDSTAQASAEVQLLDSRNVIVAQKHLSGPITSATVTLPPRFHGEVFVAVTAIGYHGERVVQSGSPQ
ncbi:MAG TPA: hypothetical protein VKT51_11325 [Candidatus Eremiobacteraceae bacterium]|nr:hypothetical protein [Candidatus Eremiobacteraceae bacterium]